jgi:hypothetical protein
VPVTFTDDRTRTSAELSKRNLGAPNALRAGGDTRKELLAPQRFAESIVPDEREDQFARVGAAELIVMVVPPTTARRALVEDQV